VLQLCWINNKFSKQRGQEPRCFFYFNSQVIKDAQAAVLGGALYVNPAPRRCPEPVEGTAQRAYRFCFNSQTICDRVIQN